MSEDERATLFATECTPVAVHDRIAALMEMVIEWGTDQGIPRASLGDTLAEILMGHAICCLSRDSDAELSHATVARSMSAALFRMLGPGRDLSITCEVKENGETVLSCVAKQPEAEETRH